MIGQFPQVHAVRTRALETSAMAIALMLGTPAFAQCAPDPTIANGTSTCTDSDANGLIVTTYGSTVVVPASATVLGAGAPAIAVRLPSDVYGSPVILSVAGRVDGGTQAGVSLLWQPAANGYGYNSANLALTVAAGGTVSGNNAVIIGQAGAGYGYAYATIDNAGILTGTNGIALLSTAPNYAGFSSIINRATGTIGAISGPVGTLNNAGTIDGGARSAIEWGTAYGPVYGDITNSGTIRSASTTATLSNLFAARTLTNSGVIANSGTGAVITGESAAIVNKAGARITSGGATAIRTNSFLQLLNAGTIDGNVLMAVSSGYSSDSRVDSSEGTINGSVIFGASNDSLVARYDGTRLITGITGAIDGGGGTDTVRVVFSADTTISSVLALPTNFERLSLAPDTKVTTTLANGFGVPGPLLISGNGTVVNRTSLSGATRAVQVSDFSGPSAYPTFINDGTILTTAGLSGTFAVDAGYNINRFANNGTITATGDGVSFSSQGYFVNTGTITASGTGVSLFGPRFDNSGTIRSTNGTGVILSGSSGSVWINSGLIEGRTAGIQIGSAFVNTGTITSAGDGVLLNAYGLLDNRAGATVSGGTMGVNGRNAPFNATVANAGTINGDVRLAGQSSGSFNGNRYFALAGGVLNGNLTLGNYDTLIAEYDARVPFSGISGTVTASNALLRYRVRTNVSKTLNAPSGFTSVGYDLYDNATLTLSGTSAQSLMLAGHGSVDLTADITASTQPAINVTSVLTGPNETAPDYNASALSITSRGTLTLDHADNALYPYAAVALGSTDSFTNLGTISVRDRAQTIYSPINAIAGGKTVINAGTLSLDGANGVSGAQSLTNSGNIVQAAGGRAATGVSNVGTLINSGTIDVAGNAVLVDYGVRTITNSGRIASSTKAAIGIGPYGYSSYGLMVQNLAGGTIAGGAGQLAIQMAGGTLDNAGTISGSVDLGYSGYARSDNGAVYSTDGGTIAGDLRFGDGRDTLIAMNDMTGVSGTIDGGGGEDLFIHARNSSGTVTLGTASLLNFELEGVRTLETDTVVTVDATAPIESNLSISGNGGIVNTATINGAVQASGYGYFPGDANDVQLAAFTNQGRIRDGYSGSTYRFVNSGTIGAPRVIGNAVSIYSRADLTFDNSGSISSRGSYANDVAVVLSAFQGTIAATNSGIIEGGLSASVGGYYYYPPVDATVTNMLTLTNSGTISQALTAVSLGITNNGTGAILSLVNSGTIEAIGRSGTGASLTAYDAVDAAAPASISISNSGTIRANDGGTERVFDYGFGYTYHYTTPAKALLIDAPSGVANITNAATGLIEATGERSSAIMSYGAGLDLTNAGTIRGTAGTMLASEDSLSFIIGRPYLAGAIQTVGSADDRIINSGTIIGSIALGAGNDRIDNSGSIMGDVFLGQGDDIFLQQASAMLNGTVDGEAGTDTLVIDATGGGAVNGDQFVNFERFSQIGQGNVAYSGNFRFDTIAVIGSDIRVAAGQTLRSDGAVTITGSDAAESVTNNGTIAGSIALGGGNDRVVNNGAILGAVALGSGDDQFVEGVGSRVTGGVDGGEGNDLYTVILAGDRIGIGQRTGFEQLGISGRGTLSLTLDQDFASVALAGNGLNLTLAGHGIGAVTGTDAQEMLTVDGDVASAVLGGGDDRLSLGTVRAAGRYDGGAGNDVLRFTVAMPVTLAGTATGFEQIALTGNALTVSGTLGANGAPLSFGEGDQQLMLASGGVLAGTIDLGAGNDAFRWSAGGLLNGTISGGAGVDAATIELAGDRTLSSTVLIGFETLASEGSGTLSLTGAHSYDRVTANNDLAILTGASLTTGQIQFGAGDNRLTIAGQFTGSIDGGAGNDRIALSGGSAAAPVAFGSVANIDSFAMASGYATIAASAGLGSVDMTGGRLVGLAGSTINASQIIVRQGATFGSAGTVNGTIIVAGTLSPGASPGTMTVNGNVALQSGSTSIFELTPTMSDKLVVNGAVSIATGATLQIVPSGTLRPGTSYDLIVASGGISGSYSTVLKPDSLFGFVVQRADRIQLLGQFLNDAAFSPQVSRSIAYANATLVAQPATSTLFAAVPALLTSTGASDPLAFAQLTPEAYASATQIGVDNGLTLADAARGPAFAATGSDVRAYSFAQTLGGWHRLGDNAGAGVSATRSNSYGFLGGIGIGNASWSVGAFTGYLNNRQRIDALGARTKADGVVAGLHARYAADGGFGITGSILYDGGDAVTDRVLPGSASASGRYGLHSWIGDVSISHSLAAGAEWAVRPRAGLTYVRTTRAGVAEAGGSPFALTVARDRHVAGFADTGLFFGRSETSMAPLRPFLSIGARYQFKGRQTQALAGYADGGLGLNALGAQRARTVGTVSAGVGYRLASGLDLFASATSQTGRDDHQEAVTAGIRMRF